MGRVGLLTPEARYQHAKTEAVWVDLSQMVRMVSSDRDRLDLIHRLSTNHLLKLEVGQGCRTVFTTSIARVLDWVVVLNRGETGLMIASPTRGTQIENWLKRNVFWNDRFQIENVSDKVGQIGIFGAKSEALLSQLWPDISDLAPYHFRQHEDGAILVRIPAPDGYWLIAEPEFIQDFSAKLTDLDVAEAGLDVYETLRIEAGVPAADHELTEDYIPLELGLWDAVSFKKGCYIGQEIIARMESRGKLAKMLVQVESDSTITVGSGLMDAEGRQVGLVTSVAPIGTPQSIGLAVIKAAVAEQGQVFYTEMQQAAHVVVSKVAGHYEAVY